MTRTRLSCCAAAAFFFLAACPARPAELFEKQLAATILKEAGTTKGICVDLGCGDGKLARQLLEQSEMFVHALARGEGELNEARRTLEASGLYGARVAAERGDLSRLPYPDYCANLVVRGDLLRSGLQNFSWAEVLRVLRPGGLAYIGQAARPAVAEPLTAGQLRKTLTNAGVKHFRIVEKNGVWALIRRPRPAGMGNWSHDLRCGPGNNRCVDDALVRAPFHTLWIGGPRRFTKFGLVVASDGRYILRHGGITHTGRWKRPTNPDRIQAFDGYNGTRLWQFRLPTLMGRGLVAVGDFVYAASTGKLVILNAADGTARRTLEPAGLADGMRDWSYYAAASGVLVAGMREGPVNDQTKRAPPTKVLIGYDPERGRRKWVVRHDPGIAGIALGEGLVFYCSRAKHVAALDIATGRERWRVPCREVGSLRYHRGRLYHRSFVLNAANGHVLVGRRTPRGILVGDRAVSGGIGGVWSVDLVTGRRVLAVAAPWDPFSPKTGIPKGGIYGRCIARAASTHCFFFTYSGTVIADLRNRTLFPTEAFRANCRTGVIAGNGLVYNSASGCACTLAVGGNVALLPVSPSLYEARPDSNPPPHLERGPAFNSSIAAPGPQADWPCFRANAARNNTTGAGLRLPLRARWKKKVAPKITPPSVAGGMVFVGSADHSIYGLDAKDGRRVWRHTTGGEVRVTPAYWRGRVYAGSQDGWVYCMRADDGRLVWRFRGAPHVRKAIVFGKPESLWPIGGGVIVDEGVVYFYAGRCSHDRVFVYALNAKTGAVVWKNDKAGRAVEVTGPKGGISPHGLSPSGIIAASKDILYVPHGPTFPAGFRKSDGKILWWNRRGDSHERSNINIQHLGGSNLSLGGGLLFAGGRNPLSGHSQRYIAINAKNGRIWGQDHPGFFKKVGRDPTGKTILPQNYKWGIYAIHFGSGIAPVVLDDGVFMFGRDSFIYGHLKSHLQAQFKRQGPGGRRNKWPRRVRGTTLAVAGDKVVVASGKTITVLSKGQGRELWRGGTGAEGGVLPNGLAIAEGQVFAATTKGELVCFEAK